MEPGALQDTVGCEVRDPSGRRLGVVASVRPAAVVIQTGRSFLFPKEVVVQASDVAKREGQALVLGRSVEDYIGAPLSLKRVKTPSAS